MVGIEPCAHWLLLDGREGTCLGRNLNVLHQCNCLIPLSPPRELAVRCIYESTQVVTSYTDFELLLEIAFALANDHGK